LVLSRSSLISILTPRASNFVNRGNRAPISLRKVRTTSQIRIGHAQAGNER
jgi:hypothetical protein